MSSAWIGILYSQFVKICSLPFEAIEPWIHSASFNSCQKSFNEIQQIKAPDSEIMLHLSEKSLKETELREFLWHPSVWESDWIRFGLFFEKPQGLSYFRHGNIHISWLEFGQLRSAACCWFDIESPLIAWTEWKNSISIYNIDLLVTCGSACFLLSTVYDEMLSACLRERRVWCVVWIHWLSLSLSNLGLKFPKGSLGYSLLDILLIYATETP